MADEYLEKAIDDCRTIINGNCKSTRGNGKIYRNTNEALASILRPEYIKGKEVLSVMASSDQPFSAYYLGAKSVDTFDSNLLAYYYFFLRKWCAMHTKKHYIPADNKLLKICIEEHNNSVEERRAYYFWKTILNELKDSLYYSELFHKGGLWWNTPYQNDMEYFSYMLQRVKPNFSHFNIFEPLDYTKQYDVIILSNILEYIFEEDDNYYYQYIINVVNNLRLLLKSDGIAISSNILGYDYSGNSFIEKYFEYEEGQEGITLSNSDVHPLYYTLRKK